jgi:hypothetical protein
MAQVMPWGSSYKVLAYLGLPTREFTLDDTTGLGELDGDCYLDGTTADDVTDRLLEVVVSRGRHDQFQSFQAGTMTLTLSNNDRQLDPVNQSSTYFDAITGTSGVTIRRKVELYFEETKIFSGRITDVDISYDPTSSPNTRSTVTIDVADDFSILANSLVEEYLPSNELAGARINTILALPEINYTGTTSIATGTILCLDDPIADQTRALDALQAVATTEQGYLFMKGDGTLYFSERISGAPTVEKLFADDGSGTEYSALSIVYGQENLFNRIICTPIDSITPGLAENATSQATFGVSALNITGLLCSDIDAQTMADYMIALYGTPSYRFDGMGLKFAGNSISTADQQAIMNLDLGSVIRVIKSFSVGSPATIFQNVVIDHMNHVITPLAHEITFKMSPASFDTSTQTATGSGTGSGTAIGLHTADRTASGTGSATAGDTAVGLHISPRTATGSGTGTSVTVGLHISARTATGSGVGSSTATFVITATLVLDSATVGILDTNVLAEYTIFTRTATGSGSATAGDTATGLHVAVQTASGSGTGTSTTVGATTLILILDSATMGKLDTNTVQ